MDKDILEAMLHNLEKAVFNYRFLQPIRLLVSTPRRARRVPSGVFCLDVRHVVFRFVHLHATVC